MTSEKIQKKFDQLPDEFKQNLEDSTEAEIREIVSKVALAEEENKAAKEADEDLAEKVELAKIASEQYRDASKQNRLKIQYAKFILEGRGKQ